jgi:hypothetical protein
LQAIDQNKIPKKKIGGMTVPAVGMGTFGSDQYTAEQVSAAVAGLYARGTGCSIAPRFTATSTA